MVTDFDIAIRGGLVFDGAGADPVRADVGVVGDAIVAVDDLGRYRAGRTVDASGRCVAPGFIDMHTHAERGLPYPELAPSVHYLKQGVTTVLGGADGYGAWPIHGSMGELSDRLAAQGIGTNAALMVGLGQVRRQVMGLIDREPTQGEIEAMKGRIRDAMDSGAAGISSGLIFAPDVYFDTDGIVGLVQEAARFGGIYHTHVRDEADGLIEAVEEAIAIGERSGATTVVTHFKAVYRRNWGKLRQATDLIECARSRGVRVYADQYPFVEGGPVPLIPPETWAGSPDAVEETERRVRDALETLPVESLLELRAGLAGVSPDPEETAFWRERPGLLLDAVSGALARAMPLEGSALFGAVSWYGMHQGPGNPSARARFVARLRDPVERGRIASEVEAHLDGLGGPDNLLVFGASLPQLELAPLAEAAEAMRLNEVDAAITLGLEGARAIVTLHSEDDVEYAMAKDFVATGSDGDYPYFGAVGGQLGAPQAIRAYSTFATKLRKYAMERGIVSLPHAIRSCTSLPSEILGWSDRGSIREGAKADIVVFDAEALSAPAGLRTPHRYSEGVDLVLVNGQTALERGEPTGDLAGRVLGAGFPPSRE